MGSVMLDTNRLSERRAHPRVPVKLLVKYKMFESDEESMSVPEPQKKFRTSHTQDVSLGGLFLVTDQALGVDDFLRLDISLPEHSPEIHTFAVVVWTNRKGGGLHFEAIKNEDVETLRRCLSRINAVL